jgi:hypothetical protein
VSDKALNAAMNAARGALRSGGDVAEAIAIGIHAYVAQRPMELVSLLSPAPGDTVFFRVRGMTMQEFDEFSNRLEPLRKQHPGVLFVAAEVEDIAVLRPLVEQDGPERLRKAAETLEAEQLMKEARGDEQS